MLFDRLISSCRLRPYCLVAALGCAIGCWLALGGHSLAVTEEERAQFQALDLVLNEAGKLYADGQFAASASSVVGAQQQLLELLKSGDRDVQRLLKPAYARLVRAHALLELEGAELVRLPTWDELTSTKNEPSSSPSSVSFAAEVAPWLITACGACHIDDRRGQFSLATYAELMGGAAGNAVLFPGSSRGSRLVEVIESGQMPQGGGRVAPEQLDTLKRWIDEGAMFDGPSPSMNIGTVANQAWASSATHEQLFQRRQDGALVRWQRALPNHQPAIAVEGDIFVLGNVMPDHLHRTLAQLTKAAEQVKRQLRIPPRETLVRGGISVFVLKSRYDYGEFGRMTESRELPRTWLGHWQADALDVYGVLASSDLEDPKQAESLALHVISGMAIGSLNATPAWFAEGVARNLVVANFRRSDPRVRVWQQSLPEAMRQVGNAQALWDGSLDEETAGLVGTSLASFMMGGANRRRFDKMLEYLRAGQTFDMACTATYASPEVLIKQWLAK